MSSATIESICSLLSRFSSSALLRLWRKVPTTVILSRSFASAVAGGGSCCCCAATGATYRASAIDAARMETGVFLFVFNWRI